MSDDLDDVAPATWVKIGRWVQIHHFAESLVLMSILARDTLHADDNDGVRILCDGLTGASASLERSKARIEQELDGEWPDWRATIGSPEPEKENDGD